LQVLRYFYLGGGKSVLISGSGDNDTAYVICYSSILLLFWILPKL